MPALYVDIYLESLISKLKTEIRSTSVVIRFSEQPAEKLQRLTIPKFPPVPKDFQASFVANSSAGSALFTRGSGRSRSATRIYRGIATEYSSVQRSTVWDQERTGQFDGPKNYEYSRGLV